MRPQDPVRRREHRVQRAVLGVDGPRRDVAAVHRRVDRDQVAVGDRVVDVVVQIGEPCPKPQRRRVEPPAPGTREDAGCIRFPGRPPAGGRAVRSRLDRRRPWRGCCARRGRPGRRTAEEGHDDSNQIQFNCIQSVGPDMTEVKRTYDASGRRARADARRRDVVQAARELFERDGFRLTTIAAVAAQAGVRRRASTRASAGEAALAKAVFDVALAGDDEPVPVAERPAHVGRPRRARRPTQDRDVRRRPRAAPRALGRSADPHPGRQARR